MLRNRIPGTERAWICINTKEIQMKKLALVLVTLFALSAVAFADDATAPAAANTAAPAADTTAAPAMDKKMAHKNKKAHTKKHKSADKMAP